MIHIGNSVFHTDLEEKIYYDVMSRMLKHMQVKEDNLLFTLNFVLKHKLRVLGVTNMLKNAMIKEANSKTISSPFHRSV